MWRPLRWFLEDRAGCLLILATGFLATAVVTFALAPAYVSDPYSYFSPKDGQLYRSMAESFVAGDEFRDPGGERSHKMSPMFPLFAAPFVASLGPGDLTLRIASFASYSLAVLALLLTTKDLFGRRAGLLLAAGYAVCPLVIKTTATYTGDNLIVATFALTLWAVLRGSREPRMLIVAGLAAGTLALLRAGFLPFLVLGAACGLGWRVHHRGWPALRCPFYLSGGALFVSMNLAWTARNHLYFGDLRGDPYFYQAVEALAITPLHQSATVVALEIAVATAVFFLLAASFRREIARSLRPLRALLPWSRSGGGARRSLPLEEWTTGLWLAFSLSVGFLVIASASFLNMEVLLWRPDLARTAPQTLHLLVFNGHWRYYLPAAVPLVWLGLMFTPRRLSGGGRAPFIAASRAPGGVEPQGRRMRSSRGPRAPEAV